jgi:hypothetical protein
LNGAALAIDGPRAAIRSSLVTCRKIASAATFCRIVGKTRISLDMLDRLRQLLWVNERADQKLAEHINRG